MPFGITVVVLVDLHIGPDVKRQRQPGIMPVLATEATNVVCATTSFHGYDAGQQGAQETQKPMPVETLP